MFQSIHLGDIRLPGRNRVHVVLGGRERNGSDVPVLVLSYGGPNGSAAGIGPKSFPLQQRYRAARGRTWTSQLSLRLPYLSYRTLYRVRLTRLSRYQGRAYYAFYRAARKAAS